MKEPIVIADYEYVEFAKDHNANKQPVLAIYGAISEVWEQVEVGTLIEWDDKIHNQIMEFEHGTGERESLVWRGEVYAIFENYILVCLY